MFTFDLENNEKQWLCNFGVRNYFTSEKYQIFLRMQKIKYNLSNKQQN